MALESILRFVVNRGDETQLDFIGVETSNFGPFGDDEDVEYRLTLDGTLVPGFERWMGLTTPLRDPIRQQMALPLPPGGVLELFARLPANPIGIGDGINAFDVRSTFTFWTIPG